MSDLNPSPSPGLTLSEAPIFTAPYTQGGHKERRRDLPKDCIIAAEDNALSSSITTTSSTTSSSTTDPLLYAHLQNWLEAESLAYKLRKDFVAHERSKSAQGQPYANIRIRVFNHEGEYADVGYTIKKVKTAAGLHAFVLSPSNVPEGFTPEVKVLFAGTMDKAAIFRDFEAGAAGKRSFENEKEILMSAVREAVSQVEGDDVKISVIGHSLGAADAMHMTSAILQELDATRALESLTEEKREALEQGINSKLTSLALSSLLSPAGTSSEESPRDLLIEKIHEKVDDEKRLTRKNIQLNLVTNSAPLITTEQTTATTDALKSIRKQTANQTANHTLKTVKVSVQALVYDTDFVTGCGQKHLINGMATDTQERFIDLADEVTVISGKASKGFLHATPGYDNKLGDLTALEVSTVNNTHPTQADDSAQKKTAMLNSMDTAKALDKHIFSKLLVRLLYKIGVALGYTKDASKQPVAPMGDNRQTFFQSGALSKRSISKAFGKEEKEEVVQASKK